MVFGPKRTARVKQQCHWGQRAHLNRQPLRLTQSQEGFALPITLGLGMVILLLGLTTLIRSQTAQTVAYQRSRMGSSLLTTEGGVARTLSQLSQPNNAPLLAHNYDTINPNTGNTYLGADGIPNNGDEGSVAVDEWSTFTDSTVACAPTASPGPPSISTSGTIGPDGQYTLRAYRYDPSQQTGTFLVEGQQEQSTSLVAVTIAVDAAIPNFPGVLASETIALRGRSIDGQNGNAYYSPDDSLDDSMTAFATPTDPTRAAYLNAIYSAPIDGATGDLVSGNIVACPLNLTWNGSVPGGATTLGTVQTDMLLTPANSPYHVNSIDLDGNETITVDTTDGPVYIHYSGIVSLRDNAKILNIRTDGMPPQVGDLRMISDQDLAGNAPLALYDQACVSMAFVYARFHGLDLLTTGDGCPSDGDTNFEGVVWAEDIVASVNISPNSRNVPGGGDFHPHIVTTSGSTTGIRVPDDVSSLADWFIDLNLPVTYKFGGVKHWQRVQL